MDRHWHWSTVAVVGTVVGRAADRLAGTRATAAHSMSARTLEERERAESTADRSGGRIRKARGCARKGRSWVALTAGGHSLHSTLARTPHTVDHTCASHTAFHLTLAHRYSTLNLPREARWRWWLVTWANRVAPCALV